MSKIITSISGKGGVGKSASIVNISTHIAALGTKTCVVDLDPLHSLTTSLGISQDEIKISIYDLMMGAIDELPNNELSNLIQSSIIKKHSLDIIPTTSKLKNLERIIPSAVSPDTILDDIISLIKDDYDYIFLDCPAGINMFVKNALVAADSALIAVEAHILSSDAIVPVEQIIHAVKRRLNPRLEIEGIIVTKYQGHTNYCQSVREFIEQEYGSSIHVFDTPVNYTIKIAEAPSYGMSIHEYAPKTKAAEAYRIIAEEVLSRGKS